MKKTKFLNVKLNIILRLILEESEFINDPC